MYVLICLHMLAQPPDIIAFDEWGGLFSWMHENMNYVDVRYEPLMFEDHLGTVPAADASLRLSDNLDLRPRSVGVWLSHSAHINSTPAQQPDLGKAKTWIIRKYFL